MPVYTAKRQEPELQHVAPFHGTSESESTSEAESSTEVSTSVSVETTYSNAVDQALTETGFEMYRDTAVVHVPPRVLMQTYRRTLKILFNQTGGAEGQHECMEDALLSMLLGVIEFELHNVVPRAMEQRVKNITESHPELVRELGGSVFQDSFVIMSEVLTHHLLWVIRGTASRFSLRVAGDLYYTVNEDLMQQPGIELHSLLELVTRLVQTVVGEVLDMQEEYGSCSPGSEVEAVLADLLKVEADRMVSSRDYEIVLEVIMRTTHRLSNESMDDLMQIRRDLSLEVAKFLLSFASPLESGDPTHIGERVVQYAADIAVRELEALKEDDADMRRHWEFILEYLDEVFIDEEERALLDIAHDSEMLRIFIYMMGSNMRIKVDVSQEDLENVTRSVLEKVIRHVELLSGTDYYDDLDENEDEGQDNVTLSAEHNVTLTTEHNATVTSLQRLLASARKLAGNHHKRQAEDLDNGNAFMAEASDWSNYATNGSSEPVMLNFTKYMLMGLEETGNMHYRYMPFGDVPERVFIDAYTSANAAINKDYVSEVTAKKCWDTVGTNFFTGLLYHQVEHLWPERLNKELYERFSPERIEEMGGIAFQSAWELMVDVLVSHMTWTLDHIETIHKNLKFYDEFYDKASDELANPVGLERVPFGHMVAEYLKSSIMSTNSIPLENCTQTNPSELASVLRHEADRMNTSREFVDLLETILRLVKRLPNETIEVLMENRWHLAHQLAEFVSSMADRLEQGPEEVELTLLDFGVNMMYDKVAEIREGESASEEEWSFLRDLTGDQFFQQNADTLMIVFDSPEHLRFLVEMLVRELPGIGLDDDVIRNLIRESMTTTVNHWHALQNVSQEEESALETDEEEEQALEQEESTDEDETMLEEDIFGISNLGAEEFGGASEGKEQELIEQGENEAQEDNQNQETNEQVNDNEENLASVTTKSVEDDQEPTEEQVDAFIEFAGLIHQIYGRDIMSTMEDDKATHAAIMSGFHRDSVRRFLGRIHSLVREKEAEGLRLQTSRSWYIFLEAVKNGFFVPDHAELYVPTPEEVTAFSDFVKYMEHTEGYRHAQFSYNQLMQHLVRIHDLSHEMSQSEQVSHADAVQWTDFVAFMQRVGIERTN